MSTPAVVPQTSVQVSAPATGITPEVTINNTAAEIQAAHAAEKAAQVETPVAPVVAAPVEPKPYTITNNPDGSVHLKIEDGGQEFKGTMAEVLENLAQSKVEGNRYIKELKNPAPAPVVAPAPVASPQGWLPDEATSVNALNNMLTQGNYGDAVGIGLTQFFGGTDPNQVKQAIGDLLQLSAELKGQKTLSEFAQKAPDFPWAESNTQLILKQLTDHNLAPTVENLVFAHNALKGMGMYSAAATQPATLQTPNPAPPNGITAPQAGDYDPWKVPLAELEANIRAGK